MQAPGCTCGIGLDAGTVFNFNFNFNSNFAPTSGFNITSEDISTHCTQQWLD